MNGRELHLFMCRLTDFYKGKNLLPTEAISVPELCTEKSGLLLWFIVCSWCLKFFVQIARIGKNRQESARIGQNQPESARIGKSRQESARIGKNRPESARIA